MAPMLVGYCGQKSYWWAHREGQPQGPWVLVMGIAQVLGAGGIPHRSPLLACSSSHLCAPFRSGAHQPLCSHCLPSVCPLLTISEESSMFVLGEHRG